MPKQWHNLAPDLPSGLKPPLGSDGNPISPDDLAPVFPMNLIEQEISTERWIDIPDEILQILAKWRPSPLHRAYALEKALKTPAKIYYKNESLSPAGSHKPNTAIAQAWYNKQFGIKKLTTETGAGQWGSALSFACALLGLECKVFMVRISFDQKPFRKLMMQTWGGKCASPSNETEFGQKVLAENPDTPGSLGIAISEAIEAAVTDKSGETRYSLGSVLNHVMLHQTIIGFETKKQLKIAGIKFARTEGIIPAPETTHAIAAAIREAEKAKEEGKEKTILFGFSGHGLMDLVGYDKFLSGELSKHEMSEEEIEKLLSDVKATHPIP